MSLRTPSSPHFHANTSVQSVMMTVLVALVPGIAVYTWLFGWGVLINISFAIILALGLEALMLKLRKRPQTLFLFDGSIIVTAVLFALCIPTVAPWWVTVVGIGFAVIVAKHLYGGLGYNVFNPAMVGYAVLLISFPKEMTAWQSPLLANGELPSFTQALGFIFGGNATLDGITSATALDYLKTQIGLEKTVDNILQNPNIFGYFGGNAIEWVNLAFLIGGLWLIKKRVINWHIPVAVLGSLAITATIFYLYDGTQFASPLFHVFSGAAILAAFFIATDPVSAATTPRGRIIYGIGIGFLIYIIRYWGGYPDGVAFAVLFMNICAPTIDYYTKPRVFGHER